MENLNDIPYEEWYNRIIDSAGIHTKSNDELWSFWKMIEPCIPDKYKLLLLLNCIYVENDNMTDEWLEYFAKLVTTESDEARAFRNEENMKMLNTICHMEGIELVDESGYIQIYRGIHSRSENWLGIREASRDLEHGISFTFNKLVSKGFAIRTQATDCNVITAKVHIDDVLTLNLDRQESEVIIRSPYLGGKLIDVSIEKIIPDIKIMRQFDKQIRVR